MAADDDAGEFRGSDRFRVVRRIGRGGMGIVYEVFDRERESLVALKTLRTWSGDALLRFKNEFRALQDIQHPNLVQLVELVEERGQWFLTMEIVPGVPFLAWVRPQIYDERPAAEGSPAGIEPTTRGNESTLALPPGPLLPAHHPAHGRVSLAPFTVDEARLRDALLQLAQGLHALHAENKVHRDIKPSNVLVTAEGRVVILDFGLITDATGPGAINDGRLVGTASYMAPEQAASKQVTPAADWYSVGVMLYQSLTGHLPILARADAVIVLKQAMVPPPPSAVVPEVPGDLNRLCVELLQIEPELRPTGRQILQRLQAEDAAIAAGLPSQSAYFVGRRRELETLDAALARSRTAGPVTILIEGESGVGKSALVRRFTESVATRGQEAVVLLGRCYERESVPYKGVDGLVDALSRHLGTLTPERVASLLPEEAGLLAQIFPVMRRIELVAKRPRPIVDLLDPQELRTRLFGALRELFRRLAAERPLVLVIDDLQWADPDSLALLTHLLSRPAAPALLLVATLHSITDDAEAGSIARRLATRLPGEVERLRLENLPVADATALVALLDIAAGDPTTAQRIATEAAGHPLFLAELLRQRARSDHRSAPLRLDEALWDRIARLRPEARQLLELIVVAGAPVVQATAAAALGIEFSALTTQLATLRAEHFVRTGGSHRSDSVEPYHYRVRAAMRSGLSADAERGWHARLAVTMEAGGAIDWEALAVHWRGAGDDGKAAQYALRAADQAAEKLAFDRAARLYRWVLEVDPAGAFDEGVRIKLGDALANAGRGAEAAAQYLDALPSATPDEALDLRRRAAEQLLRSGHIDHGLEVLRTLLAALDTPLPETPKRALASLLYRRARLRLRGLGFRERPAAEIPAAQLTRIDAFWSVAGGLAIVDTIRGADFQTRGLLLALDVGEPYRVARAIAVEAGFLAVAGGPARRRTRALLDAATAIAERIDHPHARAICVAGEGMAAFLEGRFRDSVRLLDQARDLFLRCVNVAWEMHTAHLYALTSLVFLGETAELARRHPGLLREAEERGNLYAATTLRTALPSMVWLIADQPARLRDELASVMQRWSRQGFHLEHYWALYAGCQVALYEGRAEDAERQLTTQWPALEQSLLLRIQLVQIEVHHLRARVALRLAERQDAAAHHIDAAERDAKRIEAEEMAWAEPLARLVRAGCAALRGRDDEAAEQLVAAIRTADAAELGLFAAVARARLAGLRSDPALAEAANQFFVAQRVQAPARLIDLLAPGFVPRR